MGGATPSNSPSTPPPPPPLNGVGGRHPEPREGKKGRGAQGEEFWRGKERGPLRPAAGVGSRETRLPRARQRPQSRLELGSLGSSAPNHETEECPEHLTFYPRSVPRTFPVQNVGPSPAERQNSGAGSLAGPEQGARLETRASGAAQPGSRETSPRTPPLTHRARRPPPRMSTRCRCGNS